MTNCPPPTGRPVLARVLHPHQLHALAAVHSLRAAWERMREAQRAVAAAAADDDDRGTIQAWRPGTVVSGGGFTGSGLDVVLLGGRASAEVRYLAEALGEAEGDLRQARWLALSDLGALPGTAVGAVEMVAPATARDMALWLRSADRRIRQVLQLEPDLAGVPGDPQCPVCTVRSMRLQHSAPDSRDWTVVCGIGCRCSGDGCPCGMTVAERGVTHIWAASHWTSP